MTSIVKSICEERLDCDNEVYNDAVKTLNLYFSNKELSFLITFPILTHHKTLWRDELILSVSTLSLPLMAINIYHFVNIHVVLKIDLWFETKTFGIWIL